jgi:hypothetical protein
MTDRHYAPFVEFLFLTGCRPSEAVGLWTEKAFNFHRDFLYIALRNQKFLSRKVNYGRTLTDYECERFIGNCPAIFDQRRFYCRMIKIFGGHQQFIGETFFYSTSEDVKSLVPMVSSGTTPSKCLLQSSQLRKRRRRSGPIVATPANTG